MDLRTAASSMTAGNARPRVLLADDHPRVLELVSRELSAEFDIVAAVTDGRQALEGVRRLDPDAVVLDVTMPVLDGFLTAQELRRAGSRAAVVFLTMHYSDEYAAEAMRCGARGFVPKTRAQSHLGSALHHALAGRQFLPSLTPLAISDGGSHAVQFRTTDRFWLDEAADFLTMALHRGDAIAVALRESYGQAIARGITARGWDLAEAQRQGRYLSFDASDSLARVMRDGEVDPNALVEMIDGLERARVESACGPHARLTLIGELSVFLCRSGNWKAAAQLESLWDELTRSLPILTVCMYPTDCLHPEAGPAMYQRFCAQHSAVSHATGSD